MNKVNPVVNALMRLSGEWPLSGRPPLSQQQYKDLFASYPAFVDYFPIVDYVAEEQVYLLDDYVNVAKMYEVSTRYMAAKSERSLDDFNASVALALNALPADDSNPYTVQLFVSKQATDNIGDYLESSIADNIRQQPLTQAVIDLIKQQSNQLTHAKGIFPDSRLQGDVGWRVGEQKVYLIIYRKCTNALWKKNKKTPTAQIEHDLTAFHSAMQSAGMRLTPLLPHQLINWLAPFFGNDRQWNKRALQENRALANHDIGQLIFSEQPRYHHAHSEDSERGIWQFGKTYSRYLTLGGIEKCPRSGAVTLGEQRIDGSNVVLGASFFEKLPVGSMMTYTLIPQTDAQMKFEMSLVANKAADTVRARLITPTNKPIPRMRR